MGERDASIKLVVPAGSKEELCLEEMETWVRGGGNSGKGLDRFVLSGGSR